jgi:hypothetical protein
MTGDGPVNGSSGIGSPTSPAAYPHTTADVESRHGQGSNSEACGSVRRHRMCSDQNTRQDLWSRQTALDWERGTFVIIWPSDPTDWISPYDGLHPTEAGYQEIARVWFNSIQNAFELPRGSTVTTGAPVRPSTIERPPPRRPGRSGSQGRGWVEAEWGTSELGRRAKLYRLTPKGRERLARLLSGAGSPRASRSCSSQDETPFVRGFAPCS